MKRMNFIDHLSAPRHRYATRWFNRSLSALCITLFFITLLQSVAFYDFFSMRRQLNQAQMRIAPIAAQEQEKQALETKKNTLAQLRTHITSCTQSPCSPHDTLCILTALSALPISLQSVQLRADGIDLTAHATNARHVTSAMAHLKRETSFSKLELVSISPGSKGVLFRLKDNF